MTPQWPGTVRPMTNMAEDSQRALGADEEDEEQCGERAPRRTRDSRMPSQAEVDDLAYPTSDTDLGPNTVFADVEKYDPTGGKSGMQTHSRTSTWIIAPWEIVMSHRSLSSQRRRVLILRK